MINDPVLIALILLSVEGAWLWLNVQQWTKKFFDIVPLIFILFASGMILANAGILNQTNPFFQQAIDVLLPMALWMMLITVDVRDIWHLGPMALVTFFLGMLGVMVGMMIAYLFISPFLGEEIIYGLAALTGSWTGGSANMMALKEVLQVPDHIFTLMIIADSIIPYIWMACLIFLASFQGRFDQYYQVKTFTLRQLNVGNSRAKVLVVVGMLMMGLIASLGLNALAKQLPVIKGVLSSFTWTIILVTMGALSLGVTGIGRWARQGLGSWGQWVLFFVLLCIGTKGNLSQITAAPLVLLAGLVVVMVHALVLWAMAKFARVPMFLLAAASQANLGGVASASMVAEIYRPGMAGVGLLMAILGNVVGTYAGLIVFYICRLF